MRDFRRSFAIALVLCLLSPCLASAQGGDFRGRKTKTNYFRQVGGSCIFGKDGTVIYAPAGATCPTVRNPSHGLVERVPPSLEVKLDEYAHELFEIDEALGQLGESITGRDYTQAKRLLDRIRAQILSHQRKEEILHDSLVLAPPASLDPNAGSEAPH